MRTTREEMLARAKEQRDELLETIRLTQDQEVAQAKVTAEANKTAGTQQLTRDFVADLTKQMEALAKAQEDFRREASPDSSAARAARRVAGRAGTLPARIAGSNENRAREAGADGGQCACRGHSARREHRPFART